MSSRELRQFNEVNLTTIAMLVIHSYSPEVIALHSRCMRSVVLPVGNLCGIRIRAPTFRWLAVGRHGNDRTIAVEPFSRRRPRLPAGR